MTFSLSKSRRKVLKNLARGKPLAAGRSTERPAPLFKGAGFNNVIEEVSGDDTAPQSADKNKELTLPTI